MKMLAERLREKKRLRILELLAQLEGRRLDLATLGLALRDLDLATDRTALESEIRQLERQGLVVTRQPAATLIIVLTERGDLVQRGDIEEPGVARPELP